MKTTFFVIVLLIMHNILIAQNTAIPDANFEQALINVGFDTGVPDGNVPTSNISNVSTLFINNMNISDLTGIESFTSLTTLVCNNNLLTSLDISQNTNLSIFNCSNNLLTSLILNGALSLKSLDCENNLLTNLDISQNTQLTGLYCNKNQLTSLNVSQNSILYHLNCNYNQLSSLDVTQNSELYYLFCKNNLLTSLSLSINNKERIDCSNNQLTNLYVPHINTLYCDSNQLSCIKIDSDTLSYLSTTGNTNLFCIENNFLSPNTIIKDSWTSLSNNCSNACSTLGIDENTLSNVSIYPNPSYNAINIDLREINVSKIEIYTITGQKISIPPFKKSSGTIEIDIHNLTDGVYFLKIVDLENTNEIVKFIKNN